jgi:DHA2 family methylenomycin A resistance protein-like MFS transporter
MRLLPLFALCLGFFMVIMDITVVNVVVPTIRQALNADISWLQWIVDAYALSFAGLLMTSGHLGDQLGAKRLYQLGLVVFIIASVFCGVAQTAWFLVIFRLAQGVGAALMMPTSLALIHTIYTSHQQQARAIGIWAGIGGIAAAAGPILGAFATAVMSWRAAFLINVPFGLVALLLTWRYVCPADKSPRQGLHFDRWGPVSAIITISALAFVLIEIGRLGVASPWVISAFIITAGGAITFIISQLNVRNPMLPLSCFKHPHFTIAATIGVIINIGFYGELFILPLYFHNLRHYSILTIGFALFPLMATTGISSYLAGKWIGKVGPRWPMRIGLVIGACGFFSLLIAQHNGPDYMILIIPFILIGSGIAITMPSCTIAIMKSVTAQRTGLASGVFNTCRQIGSLIGVGLFGTIIALSSDFIAGMHITLYIAGGLYLLGALIAALGMHQA